MNNRKAFTLVEVIVILVVLSILAAIAVPMALRIFERTAEDATNEEMVNVKKAMIGDPEKLQSSVRSDFGFLGDIGCLPTAAFPSAPALDRLLTQGTYPGWSPPSPTAQIGTGWKGPYITGAATGQAAAEFQNDQWGNPYTYTPAAVPCPLTATFRSSGPNGTFDGPPPGGDDIDFSIAASDSTATVSGFIKDPNGNPVGGSTVTMNFPSNGTLTLSPPATADSAGFFSFTNVPFGKRSINVSPRLIVNSAFASTGTGAAFCGPGGASPCSYIEFVLVNFSSSPVTITSFTAVWVFGPPVLRYYKVVWGTGPPFLEDCNAGACANTSGTLIGPFAGQTIAAASTPLVPVTFFADSAQTQLADIRIGKKGEVGTSVRVQLINWRDCTPPGNRTCGTPIVAATLTGITFTVTLSDGSVVQFTPVLQ